MFRIDIIRVLPYTFGRVNTELFPFTLWMREIPRRAPTLFSGQSEETLEPAPGLSVVDQDGHVIVLIGKSV